MWYLILLCVSIVGSTMQVMPWNACDGTLYDSKMNFVWSYFHEPCHSTIVWNYFLPLDMGTSCEIYIAQNIGKLLNLNGKSWYGVTTCSDPSSMDFILNHLVIISKLNIFFFPWVLFFNGITISTYSYIFLFIFNLCFVMKSVSTHPFSSP